MGISVVAMATDTTTLSIILGFFGAVITAVCGAVVAINLNKNEKKQTAETALEKALRERIVLRDEELDDVRKDLKAALERAVKAEQQRDRLYLAIAEQRAEEEMKVHDGDS